jgi:diguanylate cyclase (GGDEF)-like protein/PAS domain S-box-containing protein
MTVAHCIQSLRSWVRLLYAAARGDAGTIAAMKEEEFRILAENSMDLIVRVGPDRRTSYVSPACSRILGYEPEEVLGRPAQEFVLEQDFSAIVRASNRLATDPSDRVTAEFRIYAKNRDLIWMEASAQMIRCAGPGGNALVVLRDISERKKLEEGPSQDGRADELTRLMSRSAFEEVLGKEWRRAVRNGSRLSLLLVGVDHLKKYNDLYGQPAGEDCLCAVAEAVHRVVQRSGDAVARYGWEEIATILPETDLEGAITVGEEIRKEVRAAGLRYPDHPDGKPHVTVSIGAASVQAVPSYLGYRMPESLLIAADEALRKADKGGRDAVYTAAIPGPDGRELTA